MAKKRELLDTIDELKARLAEVEKTDVVHEDDDGEVVTGESLVAALEGEEEFDSVKEPKKVIPKKPARKPKLAPKKAEPKPKAESKAEPKVEPKPTTEETKPTKTESGMETGSVLAPEPKDASRQRDEKDKPKSLDQQAEHLRKMAAEMRLEADRIAAEAEKAEAEAEKAKAEAEARAKAEAEAAARAEVEAKAKVKDGDVRSISSRGPRKAYKFYSYKKREWFVTKDFWAARQADPNHWEPIWVWVEDGKIDHLLTEEEMERFLP